MFLYFMVITFSVYVVKPAKESLFLNYLGKERLPYAFLLTAFLMAMAVAVNSRLLQRLNRPRYIASTLLFFTAGGLVFWKLIDRPSPWPWIFLLLYSWGDILLVTAITQFWIFINDLFNPREAKRQIGFFVSGGLLGGIGGSLIALSRPGHLQTEDLVLIGPLMLVICLAIVFYVQRLAARQAGGEEWTRPGRKDQKAGFIQSFALVTKNRYLLLLSGMILASIVVSNLVDFQFKSVAQVTYPNKDVRTSFLGTFYLVILLLSYLFTALGTSRMLKNLRLALLILPVLLLAGSLSLFLLPGAGIVWAVIVKGTDKSLSHSLNQSVRELLYIPLPQDIKYKAKVFIDMFLNKFADGLAGLVLLAVSPFIKFHVEKVSYLVIAFVILWIFFGRRVHREYVTIVKNNLQIKWQDADKLITEKIDLDMTKLVIDTLENRERSSVLYAMNCFELIKKEKMSPELKKLISFKTDEIRARAMGCLLDVPGDGLVPEFDDEMAAEALDGEIKEIMALDVYQTLMKEQIEKATHDTGEGAEVSRMEAAKVIGMMAPDASLTRELKKLLKDPSPEVARYAAGSAEGLRKREFVPLLVGLLGRSAAQEAAARALAAYGTSILGTLRDYLSDPGESIQVRRAISGIMARTGSQRAVDILVLELSRENSEVETEIIEALHRMRMNDSSLLFPAKRTLTKTVSLIKKCYLLILQIHDFRADRKKEILAKDLEGNLSRTMKNIFELLGLVYPQEDIVKAYQNILAGTKKALDYSVELLDNILRKEVKDLLLPLIEDTSFEFKVGLYRKMIKAAEKIELS
jgi:ATP/ADP translocase/HEAT repeat protein